MASDSPPDALQPDRASALRDINGSHPPEEALRIASERIELALNSGAVVGTWVWDLPRDNLTADERFARTFALDAAACREGLPIKVIAGSIHPDDWPRVETVIAETIARGGPCKVEYRVRRFDGPYRWVEANGRCDLDAQGRPLRFPGVLIDIDERKRMEDRLRQSESEAREASRLLRAIIEAIPASIYVKDRDGRLLIANKPVLDAIGKSWEEVQGRTSAEFLEPEQAEAIMATDRRLMETGAAEEIEEALGYDAEGPRVWISSKRAFHNEEGRIVGLVGSSTEITSRKRAEDERQLLVRELNHRVKNLFTLALSMVTMTARNVESVEAMAEALRGRLMALAQAHELVLPSVANEARAAEGATMHELVTAVVAPYLSADSDQLRIQGPAVHIGRHATTSLVLVLHELATNAAKYGALSVPDGCLEVAWRTEDDGVVLVWTETGGPPIETPPERGGFGSQLARASIVNQLGGEIAYDWEPFGARVTLSLPSERLQR